MTCISLSILDVQGNVNAYLRKVSNADSVHIDVLDGKFVKGKKPGKNIWIRDVKKLRTSLPKHVHLMTKNPENHVSKFIKAGADMIQFHIEATKHPQKVIDIIKKHKKKACIAIDPETPISKIKPFLSQLDQVLVMDIHPGRGGQRFLKSVLPKIRALKKHFKGPIEVDGGINPQTARLAVKAGATDLVVGSYLLHHANQRQAVKQLRLIR